jgi:hypothetical protein
MKQPPEHNLVCVLGYTASQYGVAQIRSDKITQAQTKITHSDTS